MVVYNENFVLLYYNSLDSGMGSCLSISYSGFFFY